ncbi:MAG: S-layer homology domain-containing protein, partial [Firmicutes bacterium]|nr:S-layer homology domain-containing protein [Bacillota bacterium]
TLTTLDLLRGFPDGTFRPGETITRAQFCAVAVRALGLETAAEYAAGATMFPDVPATHWASGYINIAVDQGIIKGYTDGTFRPEAPVSYVEALAMLVRVLGYDPAVRGSWPTNYLVKSFELGISKGVSFSANAPATRGDVALFTDNCLEINLMEQTVVGDQVRYEVVDKTLLDSRLGYEAVSGVVEETGDVLGTDLDSDEAIIAGETYQLAKGVDLTPFIGLEVKAWLDGETVLLAKVVTDPDAIYSDSIAEVDGGWITLSELDDEYELSDDAVVYWNFVHEDAADVDAGWEGADVTVVLDEEDVIVALIATQFEGSWVIRDVDVDDEELFVVNDDGGKVKIELGDYDVLMFFKDGAEVEIGDLELWDVAHYAEYTVDGDEVLYLELVDEKVSGELEEIGLDADDNIILTVDGDEYTVGDASCSTDDNGTFGDVDEASIEAFAGADVELYLDRYGDVRHVVASLEEEEAPATVGMIVSEFYSWGPTGDEEYFVKVLTAAGKVVRYGWDDDTFFTAYDLLNEDGVDADLSDDEMTGDLGTLNALLEEGTVISFSLTSGGLLDGVEEYLFDNTGWTLDEDDIDADYNVIKVGGVKYKVTSGTVIFDECPGDEEVVSWDTFEDVDIGDDDIDARMFCDEDRTIDILVVNSDGEVLTYPGVADVGVVLKRVVTADGTAFKVLVEDESGQYLAEDAALTSLVYDNWSDVGADSEFADIDVGDLISFELNAAGDEFLSIEELDASYTDGDTYYYAYINEGGIDEDNLILEVRTHEDKDDPDCESFEIVLTDDTVFYDVTGRTPQLASFEDLDEDMCIQFFDVDDDGLIDFVKITEAD